MAVSAILKKVAAWTRATIVGLALVHQLPVHAAESALPPDLNDPVAQEPIEEIQIIGQRSLTDIRLEVLDSQVRMYDLYNALNTNDALAWVVQQE